MSQGIDEPIENVEMYDGVIVAEEPKPPDVIVVADSMLSETKRKRDGVTESPNNSKSQCIMLDEAGDDGSTCLICLDSWELAGPHRLTSLKCGHLFGKSCIKRWIEDNAHQNRSCPQCKKRATQRDFRFIYAKRVTAIDNSVEMRVRDQLKLEREKYLNLEIEHSILQKRLCYLQQIVSSNNIISPSNSSTTSVESQCTPKQLSYELILENNIQLGCDVDCRVMMYNKQMNSMVVTHKSSQFRTLFRGYGACLIDLATYRPSTYLHLAEKVPRDLALCTSDNLLVAASLEKTSTIYNLTSRTSIVTIIPPTNDLQALLWSCCFNQARKNYLYFGTNYGKTYVYDIRQPNDVCLELITPHDYWPVINLTAIPPSIPDPEHGGILVCKLKSLWFFEYQRDGALKGHELNTNDTYICMSYDIKSKQILITARTSLTIPNVRYIVGRLVRKQSIYVFDAKITIDGSQGMASILRSTIISMNSSATDSVPDYNNRIVAGYQEDLQQLNLWCANSSDKLYSLPIQNTVYDLASFEHNYDTFLGGLTENELKIYKICTESI